MTLCFSSVLMTLWNREQETRKLGLCYPILRRLIAECQSAQLYTLGVLAPLQQGKLNTAYLAHRLQLKPLDGTQKATIWGSGKANKSRQRVKGSQVWRGDPQGGEVSHFIFFYLFLGFAQRVSLSQSWTVEQGAAQPRPHKDVGLPRSCARVRWTQSSITEACKNELRFTPMPLTTPSVTRMAQTQSSRAKTWKLNWGT